MAIAISGTQKSCNSGSIAWKVQSLAAVQPVLPEADATVQGKFKDSIIS